MSNQFPQYNRKPLLLNEDLGQNKPPLAARLQTLLDDLAYVSLNPSIITYYSMRF